MVVDLLCNRRMTSNDGPSAYKRLMASLGDGSGDGFDVLRDSNARLFGYANEVGEGKYFCRSCLLILN